jgi:hypothetical protein
MPKQMLSNSSLTLQSRMSKIGGIQLLPMEIVQPKPQEPEVIPESVEEAPQPPPRTSPASPEASNSKPVPAERKISIVHEIIPDDLEQRVTVLEDKVEKLSTNPVPSTSAPQSMDKYEFAMDLWAQLASSSTIPAEVKPEIKKIILYAAFQP